MDPGYSLIFAIFLICIVASAFFSGTETAFFSLSELELSKLREEKGRASRRVIKLMNDSRKLLITILVGNTVVNIIAAIDATVLVTRLSRAYHFSEGWAIFLEVVVVTLIILIFSEITPKILAVRNSLNFALRVSPFVDFFYLLLYPVSSVLERFTDLFKRALHIRTDAEFLSEEEIKTLIELGEEKGTIQSEERMMIDSIFEFGETTVKEIMVPRIDMVCIEVHASLKDLIRLIRERGHSRIPIYEGRIDNIRGIVHVKDLIPFLDKSAREVRLADLARPAYFVPESKKIDDLLREFQRQKVHMAIVVDEYGGTAGLVTLEDIIEEIVGEIQDEYDKEAPLFQKLGENALLVDGRMPLEELNEVLPEPITVDEDEDFETLGGLIYHITERIPQKNERIRYGRYEFHVVEVVGQRIKKVKVVYRKRPQEAVRRERETDAE